MRVHVQQGKVSYVFNTDEAHIDLKVDVLMDFLESKAGILKRQQKLIYKAKVLLPFQTFEQAKVTGACQGYSHLA